MAVAAAYYMPQTRLLQTRLLQRTLTSLQISSSSDPEKHTSRTLHVVYTEKIHDELHSVVWEQVIS